MASPSTPPSTCVSSDDTPSTVEQGGTVFYRRSDIRDLIDELRRAGHAIDMDYTLGTTPDDVHIDVAPYSDVHLRTQLGEYVTTSVALIVTKGTSAPTSRRRWRRRTG